MCKQGVRLWYGGQHALFDVHTSKSGDCQASTLRIWNLPTTNYAKHTHYIDVTCYAQTHSIILIHYLSLVVTVIKRPCTNTQHQCSLFEFSGYCN